MVYSLNNKLSSNANSAYNFCSKNFSIASVFKGMENCKFLLWVKNKASSDLLI